MLQLADHPETSTLRCMIDSDLEKLNALHKLFGWLPNSERSEKQKLWHHPWFQFDALPWTLFRYYLVNSRIRPSEEVLRLKREKLEEVGRDWRSFTDYILHTVFSRACDDVDEIATSNLRCSPGITEGDISLKCSNFSRKKKVLNFALHDGSNEETLQLVFIPNEFPYNLSNGFHWTLWYNTPTQPYENERITEDISVKLTGCHEEDEETDFGWYVTLLTLLCFWSLNVVNFCHVTLTQLRISRQTKLLSPPQFLLYFCTLTVVLSYPVGTSIPA